MQQRKHVGSASKRNRRTQRLYNLIEKLEQRRLLTTTLYIDYGDRFPAGVLSTTVGAIDNTTSGANPNMDGPTLIDGSGVAFAAATAVTVTSVNTLFPATAATLRAQMTALAQRFYQGLDITVVELTANFQNVNGFNVRSAASTAEISQTLGLNEATAENNDGYVLVGKYVIGAANFNPALSAYGGLSTGTDIAGNNNNDGTALVCLRGDQFDTANFNGNQIAHEAGHTFSLRHVYRQNTGSAPPALSNTTATGAQYDRLHQSEIMSYLGYETLGGYSFFTRYPQMQGDGNTNANVVVGSPTPFDELATDPTIGPNNLLNYVTGTGENDLITISKTAANVATVSVSAFDDTAFTVAVDAPGATGNTFTYTISLDKPLLIDAGGRNDRVTIDGDLGVTVTLRGMHGTDELWINGKNAASATVAEAGTNLTGSDGNPDRRGTVTIGTTVVNYQEFESTSLIRVINVTALTLVTPLAADILTYGASGTESNISGSSGAIVQIPLRFTGVTTFTLDCATNGAGNQDTITLNIPATPSLTGVKVTTGDQNDTITMNASGTTAVVTVQGNAGNDTLNITNASGANPVFLAGAGTTNTVNVNSGTWTANADLGASAQVVTVNASGGNVIFGSTQHLATLSIATANTATLTANANKVLVVGTLTMTGNAKVELNNNDLLVKGGTTKAVIENAVRTAYNFQTWTGPSGIFSDAAKNNATGNTSLGTLSGTEFINNNGGLFNGETILANYVLVKYTYFGDVNLSGQVDSTDYNLADFGFVAGLTGWANGNVDYAGGVDSTDYNLIDFSFVSQSGIL